MPTKNRKTSAKKLAGNERYLAKLERVTIRLHKDGSDGMTVEQIRHAAEQAGQSVNQWIVEAIRDKL